jgi:serine phosphatase RsbU (regulator of sigma subunit)
LVRGLRVVRELSSAVTLPAGIGGDDPEVAEEALQPGDRVLFYTDGVVEERAVEGREFGKERMVDLLLREVASAHPVVETVRRVSHTLLRHRGGTTTDDATIFLVEWHGRGEEPG